MNTIVTVIPFLKLVINNKLHKYKKILVANK